MFSKKTILAFVSAPILSIIPSTSLEQGYNRLENYPDNSIVHISYGDIVTPKETDKNGKIKIGEKYLTWDGRTAHATRLIGGKECNGQNAIITARHLLPNKIEIE
jgi:hypothetical protein